MLIFTSLFFNSRWQESLQQFFWAKSPSSSLISRRNPYHHTNLHTLNMPHTEPDSPSSSVQSSPNAPLRFLPLYILETLSPSKQVIPIISDSDSDEESAPLPTSYYASPSRPEK